MIIQDLLDIINEKQANDKDLLSFQQYLSSLNPQALLTEDVFLNIKALFKKKWQHVVDTDEDYTVDIYGKNAIWIKIARLIAANRKDISVSRLLFPNLTLTTDLHNFKQLASVDDYTHVYLGRDNKLLFELIGLIKHIVDNNFLLSSYNDTAMRKRVLSINELSRIRRNGRLNQGITFKEKAYPSVWAFIYQEVFPKMEKKADLPLPLLQELIHLITEYFHLKEKGDFSEFKDKFKQWKNTFDHFAVAEVNALYGTCLLLGDKEIYLLELLMDIEEARDFIVDKPCMLIAQWFCSFDPSMLVHHPALDSIYRQEGVGNFFTLDGLRSSLCSLSISDPSLQRARDKLLEMISRETEITETIILSLQQMYELRWQKVLSTELDYTRKQSGENKTWIRLAQLLAGAGCIPSNYYSFLMPGLRASVEETFQCPIHYYPLSHYILSGDGAYLILLDACLISYDTHRLLRYQHAGMTQALSEKEKDRMKYASPYIQSLFSGLSTRKKFRPVSLKTVYEVRNLINFSFFKRGLYESQTYSKAEQWSADEAFHTFHAYYNQLDIIEQEALNAHRIEYKGVIRTFEELMTAARKGEECFALINIFLIQFVLNYLPYQRFKGEVEECSAIDLEFMRKKSKHWVTSDYDFLSAQEAKNRCLCLFVSLMTYNFKRVFGYAINYRGLENFVHYDAKNIFSILHARIKDNNYKDIRFVYAAIMAFYIQPAIEKELGFIDRLYAYMLTDDKPWYVEIAKNQIAGLDYKFYPIVHLRSFLLQRGEEFISDKLQLHALLKDMIKVSIQAPTHSEDQNNVLINIFFVRLLKTMTEEKAKAFITALNEYKPEPSSQYHEDCFVYLISHIFQSISHEAPEKLLEKTKEYFSDKIARSGTIKALLLEFEKYVHSNKLKLNAVQTAEVIKLLRDLQSGVDQGTAVFSELNKHDCAEDTYISNLEI